MDYRKHVQQVIDYIEENLRNELTLENCVRASGYSQYHFIKIFKQTTGLTPIGYVRKRRLSCIAREIIDTNDPLIDIAFRWDYQSLENFIRSFKSEHDVTPGVYRSSRHSLHLYEPLDLVEQERHRNTLEITPAILDLKAFILTGFKFSTHRRDSHLQIPQFWNHYHTKRLYKVFDKVVSDHNRVDIGLSPEVCENGSFDYIIGIAIGPEKMSKITLCSNMVSISISPTLYAIFDTPPADSFTFVETIHKTWDFIFETWLPQSNYQRAPGPVFESYCEESHSFSEQINMPVQIKYNGRTSYVTKQA
jgi:AraC family transcriptional regulator